MPAYPATLRSRGRCVLRPAVPRSRDSREDRAGHPRHSVRNEPARPYAARVAVKRLTDVVTGGLCSGCGICASLAGDEGVQMALSPVGQLRPRVPRELDPAVERLALDACPGATIMGPRPARGVPVHPV